MSPFKVPALVNGRGKFPIQRSFKGVGPIRVSSGTTDPKTFQQLMQMLDDLYNTGNLTTLESIRDRVVTPLEVLNSVKTHGLGRVIQINQTVGLIKSITDWLDNTPAIKDATRKGYKSHLAGFFKTCKSADTLRHLVPRVEQYRKVCQKSGKHRSFNQVRAALMSYVRSEFKKKSNLYHELKDVDVLPVTVRKVHNDAVSVEDIVRFTRGMKPEYSDMVWTMCSTGMRPGEYFEQNDTTWEIKNNAVEITKANPGHGNKGFSRVTILPFPATKADRSAAMLKRAINTANETTGLSLTPNSFRKCFAHWAELSKIPESRSKAYMGHQRSTIHSLYTGHNVTQYLKDDADKFKAFVDKGKKQGAVPYPAALAKFFHLPAGSIITPPPPSVPKPKTKKKSPKP